MKKTIQFVVAVLVFGVLGHPTFAHHASFESDLPGGDSTLESPWHTGQISIAWDHYSYLAEGDVDYISFDGEAGQEVADLFVLFPSTLEFLPKVVIAGPGMSGGSVPDWVEVPEGMGIMDYEYALDFLTEEAFGELDTFIILASDDPRPFTLPETGLYYIIIYHEEQQAGYYNIAHGESHDVGEDAENWEVKLDNWVKAALGITQSSVSIWSIYK
jgi:hypothetical protein